MAPISMTPIFTMRLMLITCIVFYKRRKKVTGKRDRKFFKNTVKANKTKKPCSYCDKHTLFLAQFVAGVLRLQPQRPARPKSTD